MAALAGASCTSPMHSTLTSYCVRTRAYDPTQFYPTDPSARLCRACGVFAERNHGPAETLRCDACTTPSVRTARIRARDLGGGSIVGMDGT